MKIFLTTLLAGMAAVTAVMAAEPTPAPYPLNTCVVSGEKLGGMGKPYVFTYEGSEVELCCAHCKPEFDKDPAKYLKAIQAAKTN